MKRRTSCSSGRSRVSTAALLSVLAATALRLHVVSGFSSRASLSLSPHSRASFKHRGACGRSVGTHNGLVTARPHTTGLRRVVSRQQQWMNGQSNTEPPDTSPNDSISNNSPMLRTQNTTSSTAALGTGRGIPTPPGPTVVLDDDALLHPDIFREAITRTLCWILAAGIFGGGLWTYFGPQTGEEFFAGYLVEQSLSVDNLFVFLVLFEFFGVPLAYQDRVLNWGIYGAIVMRAVMIGLGAAALERFRAILLVFAGILVYSSAKVLVNLPAIIANDENSDDDDEEDVGNNSIIRFVEKLIDATDEYDGNKFFTMVDGVRKATPLFICMVAVEISDVVFAVDSIPAVFGVTENPLVVFSSNMFAIMGLRSLYTILSKAAADLKFLEPAVAVVLGFIGSKMIAEYLGVHIATEESLAVVVTCLGAGVGLSVLDKQNDLEQKGEEDASS